MDVFETLDHFENYLEEICQPIDTVTIERTVRLIIECDRQIRYVEDDIRMGRKHATEHPQMD